MPAVSDNLESAMIGQGIFSVKERSLGVHLCSIRKGRAAFEKTLGSSKAGESSVTLIPHDSLTSILLAQ